MKIKEISKRSLSVFLSLVMTVGLVSSVFATDDAVKEETAIDTIGAVESTDEAKATEPIIVEDETDDFDVFGDYEDDLSEYQYVSLIDQYGTADKAHEALEEERGESAIEIYAVKPLATVGNIYAYWDNSSHTLTFTNGTSSASGDKYDLTSYNGDRGDLPWGLDYPNHGEHYYDIPSITSVVIADDIYPGNMTYWFYGFENATFSGLSKLHTDYCTSLYHAFYNCDLTQSALSDIANWNTSNVTNASWIFGGTKFSAINGGNRTENGTMQSIDLSKWDLSNATDISGILTDCDSVTTFTFPNSSSRVPNAKYMEFLLADCANLTTINNLSLLNTSNTTRMYGLFQYDENLSGTMDLSSWDFSNVEEFYETFYDCQRITTIKFPSSSSKSMRSLIAAGSAFNGCTSLKAIDNIELWDITTIDESAFGGLYKGISDLFSGCSSLTSMDLSSWNFSNVSDLNGMFYDCFNLESVKFPTNTATGPRDNLDEWAFGAFSFMFSYCRSLTELDLSGFTFYYGNYNSLRYTDFLYGCIGLKKITFGSGLNVEMALPEAYDVNGWNNCWYNSNGTKYTSDNSAIGYVIPSGAGTYYSYDRNHTHNWTSEFWWPYFDDPEDNAWWGYAEDYCTVHLTCSGCLTEDYGYCDVAKTTLSADCTDYGQVIYTATYTSSLGGNSVSTVRTIVTSAPLGHNWTFVSSSLDSTHRYGSISIECSRCGTTFTITGCTVTTIAHKDATCTDEGYTTYRISGSHDGQSFSDEKTVTSSAVGHKYSLTSSSVDLEFALAADNADTFRQTIVDYAIGLRGTPYLIGGRGDTLWSNAVNNTGSDLVFDCAGLTQYVYEKALAKSAGLSINLGSNDENRWSPEEQWTYKYAYNISTDGCSTWDQFTSKLELGDLIFFNRQADTGMPGHVGIYIGNGQMVDANSDRGEVVIETLAQERNLSSCMGARRFIAGVGESFANVGIMTYTCSRCGDILTMDNLDAYIYSCTLPSCTSTGSVSYSLSSQITSGSITLSTVTKDVPKSNHITNYNTAIATFNYLAGTADLHSTCTCCNEEFTTYGLKADYDFDYSDYNNDIGEYGISVLSMSLRLIDEDGEVHTYQDTMSSEYMAEIDDAHKWVLDESTYIKTTCTEDGYAKYICEDCDAVKTVESKATGHNWSADFTWNDDYTECTVEFTCLNCGEKTEEPITAEISSETDGDNIIYTATVTFDDQTFTDLKTVAIQKSDDKGSNPGEPKEPTGGDGTDDGGNDTGTGTDTDNKNEVTTNKTNNSVSPVSVRNADTTTDSTNETTADTASEITPTESPTVDGAVTTEGAATGDNVLLFAISFGMFSGLGVVAVIGRKKKII